MNKNIFIWSDGWCIKDNKAWFVDGMQDTLYCLDFNTKTCEYVAKLPNDKINKFRLNSYCIKVENEVFCMPDVGECIWIYDVIKSEFSQITIDNPNSVRLSCIHTWQCGDKIFTFSGGLKQIIEIDIKKKVIKGYYKITNLPDETISHCTKVGENVYLLSSLPNKIYQFDLDTKQVRSYILPGIERRLFTISFDGSRFWLSGYKKEIYVWDKEKNHIETLCDFPQEFGEYDFSASEEHILNTEKNEYKFPTFIESRAVGETIWFIPFQTNRIIYVDRNTYKVQAFEISEEEETRESLMANAMGVKYVVQYVSDNRYLGIFSFKNYRIIEIDTETFRSAEKTATFDFRKYDIKPDERVFQEYILQDRRKWRDLPMEEKGKIRENMQIGEKIYKQM